jgi:hypothetical protein
VLRPRGPEIPTLIACPTQAALMGVIQKSGLSQDFAIQVLGNAGPPVAEAVPVLRDVAKTGAPREREASIRALKRIELKPGEK